MAACNLSGDEIKRALAQGEFLHVRELGEGGFGKVVHAMHKLTQQPYAIKTMICNTDEQIKYQKRELELLTSTKPELSTCSHIIRYYNSWILSLADKRILCIQMELCYGSLHKVLVSQPNIVKEGNFYKHLFPQILRGLKAIHDSHWVHRDIYPPNILIANPVPSKIQDTVIKIADFGLARKLGSSGSGGRSAESTLNKLSPEIGMSLFRAPEMSTDNYTQKVDLYSAGLVLYLLCRHLENYESKWQEEICALRNGQRDKQNLCHQDKKLIEVLCGLLMTDPEDRLSASDALARFEETETDGFSTTSWSNVRVFVRGDGETEYSRCHFPVDSYCGLSQGIQDAFQVNKENQIICHEYKADDETIEVKISCEQDFDKMMRSADRTGRVVKLVVANKEAPQIVVCNRDSCNEEVSNNDLQ